MLDEYILRRDALNEFHEWIVSNDGNIFSLADALEAIPAAHVAEALKGAIKWNDGIPKQDMPVCYVCQTNQDGSFTIRPAVYKKNSGVYLIEDYTEDGSYVLRRVAEEDIRLWAEVTIPFSTRFTFSPPTP